MNTLDVTTTVHVPPPEVFEFLLDFPGYAEFSEYLQRVEQDGDGTPGTVYALTFAWWRLSHTVESEVTAVDRPDRIEWELLGAPDAHGHWGLEAVAAPDDASGTEATEVTFHVAYDPDSVGPGVLDLPALVSFDSIVDRALPKVESEAERVVERVVADLEGDRRAVDLTVETA